MADSQVQLNLTATDEFTLPLQRIIIVDKWHVDCALEFRYEEKGRAQGYRAYWCAKHQQWTYEYPVKVTFTYADGSSVDADER